MTTWTEQAAQFLQSSNHPLAGWWHPGLELQADPVEQDDPDWRRYHEPGQIEPHPKRLPKGGDTAPEDNDGPLSYSPYLVERFGWSGWDYARGLTEFVGFDFDVDHGNAQGAERIARLDQWAASLPYVTSTTSKGGKGRHWYVRVAVPIPAAIRSDHRRVAGAILATINADLATDLLPYVDCYGAIMHFWARHKSPEGFALVKLAARDLTLPNDWQTLADTIGKRTRYKGISAEQRRVFDAELVANSTELDDEHRSIVETMEQAGFTTIVENCDGRTIIKLHTAGLALDYGKNKRRGPYATTSPGNNPQQPNAYAFLLPNGGLAVRRFGAASEAACWHKGPSGAACINYNVSPTFDAACDLYGGVFSGADEYTFAGEVAELMRQLGVDFELPKELQGRPKTVKRKGNMLIVTVPGTVAEGRIWTFPGWKYDRAKWTHYIRDSLPADAPKMYDDRIRFTTENKKKEAWHYLDSRGAWIGDDASGVKTYIKGHGHKDAEVAEIIKHHQCNNWRLTRVPFADEYPDPAERTWNRDGARLSCKPAAGICIHWQMILDHCGRGLDEAVHANEWCRLHGMQTGGDYLLWWAAIMVRHPTWRLPYLFFFSERQNTGKSTFHRALRRLFEGERGATEIRKELTKDDFNDALVGAALCVVEEIDLSADYRTYDLVKNYVDSPSLKIRGMFRPGNDQLNYTHWIHTANNRNYCPVYPGDSRIVMARVEPFELDDKPWLTDLQPKIDAECPAFLAMLYDVPLPKRGVGRLSLPVLETLEKREAMAEREASMNDWFIQLRELAAEDGIQSQTANQIHDQLCERRAWTDAKFPKNASALAPALKRMEARLRDDGFKLTYTESTKHKPAVYTIARV